MSRLRVAAAVVIRDGRILLTQRSPTGAHPGQWEFPGGKIEDGEDARAALARELAEELGVEATPGAKLAVAQHDYESGEQVEIQFFECELAHLRFTPSEAVAAVRWARPAEVDESEVVAADRAFLQALAGAGG